MRWIVTLILITALPGPFSHRSQSAEEPKPAEAAAEKKEPSRVSHGSNGEVIVTLDGATQQRIGLSLAAVAATNLPPEVKGYGRVLDPTPLITLFTDLAPAQVAAEASRRELDRLKVLRAQENASERALQAAEAQALRDRLAVEAFRAKLALGWGQTIAKSDKLPALVKALAEQQAAVVRIDVPAGDALPGKPVSARLVSLADGAKPITAEVLGAATSTDPQLQGQGFLFLVRDSAPPAGAALTGCIVTDGAPLRGLLIPADAVVRHEAKGWVYVQRSADKFTRREVGLGRATDGGYFVTGGFAVSDKVVMAGAQLLLSEELKGQGGEE